MKIKQRKMNNLRESRTEICLLSISMFVFCCSSVFEHFAGISGHSLLDTNVLKLLENMLYIYFFSSK